jgi:hypothetical protein
VAYAVVTASGILKSIVAMSERRARQRGPTWVYCLDWPGRALAAHAIDTALVIGDPSQNWRTHQQSSGAQMAGLMSASFLAFGRTGDPNVSGLPTWPRFNLESRPTMILELEPRVENDHRREERLLFATRAFVPPRMDEKIRAASPPSPEFTPLQRFLGEWVMPIGNDPDGTTVELILRVGWQDAPVGATLDGFFRRGVERRQTGRGVFIWDATHQRFLYEQNDMDGTSMEGIASMVGESLELVVKRKNRAKQEQTVKSLTKVDGDSMVTTRYHTNSSGDWEQMAEERYERRP